jgi:cyclophilin family peptidyl-prolyl cis-trans isomerase/protein-disulfide isomerase
MKKVPSLITILVSTFILISCANVPVANPSAYPETAKPTSTPTEMPCTLLHVPVTPQAAGAEFGDRAHEIGPVDAPVMIVFFSDYQCPACVYMAASLKKIRTDHPTDVRLIYLNIPLAERDKDALALQAAEAADLLGKFWEMNDLLFEKQAEWSALAPGEFAAWASQQAAGLGMDAAQFQADFQGEVVESRLQQASQSSGNPSILPPVLFVNSASPYSGLADFASLDAVVRMEALTARQFIACPTWDIDPLKQYVATLHTAKGDVVVQLYPEKAPLAVNNFIFLARRGWYDGVTFYRVLPNLLAAAGDPSETGMGNPGYLFETEIPVGLSFNQTGMLAMDNSGPDTNGSRFFITLGSAVQWNGQYTIFGNVLSGLEVLSALTARDPLPGISLPPGDELISVTIEER